MADHEFNSLIDWSGPVVECTNKPLIPLPSLTNPIDVGEDNPFDAVERQINENEPLDIFSLNISCNDINNSKCEEVNKSDKEFLVYDMNDVSTKLVNADLHCGRVDDLAKNTYSSKENEVSSLDVSVISNLSSLSDLKELVLSRISHCFNKARNPLQNSNIYEKSSIQHSPLDYGESISSTPSSGLMNDCFVERSENSKDLKTDGVEFIDTVDGEWEDLQSIKPNWNEFILSSSDEENEKLNQTTDLVEKLRLNNPVKKKSLKQIEKTKDLRAPLTFKDPNIRIRKINGTSKHGPLKAVAPLNSMKKINERKLVTETNSKITLVKSKVTSSNPSKLKRWSSPIATSTPQSLKSCATKCSKQSVTASSSRNLSLQKRTTSQTFSYPPSPDSTSDCRGFVRTSSAVRVTPRSILNRSCDTVSSSTKGVSRMSSRISNDLKANSFPNSAVKTSTKISNRNVRNKENLKV